MPTDQLHRITLGARFFALVALVVPAVIYHQQVALLGVIAVGGLWGTAALAEQRRELATAVPLLEAGLIGILAGVTLGAAPIVSASLAVAPFCAAVLHGLRLAVVALSTQLALAVPTVLIWREGDITADATVTLFTWSTVGLGLAFIGNFLHVTLPAQADELTPYRHAQDLLRQLLTISDDLHTGLDVTVTAGELLDSVTDSLPNLAVGAYTVQGETLLPLATRATHVDAAFTTVEDVALDAWHHRAPLVYERTFGFPVGRSVVVAGRYSTEIHFTQPEVERVILRLITDLAGLGVKLETALLFADFRASASSDVRTRLAREMHDGIAQDIASLGYLVDALAARPADEKQAKQLAMVRQRITKIVAEVRQSVLTLRTSIGESQSLGEAISNVARHLSESSQIPIQVTLDEHSSRLRPEVESELFRIAQEAMNNAIKHAQCTTIEVTCQVHAPRARIVVTDDGRGMQQARSDSHGMNIMRERARLAGADLTIGASASGGLRVEVLVHPDASFSPTPAPARVAP
ncbi:sensor histidine kinase [Nocardioides sp. R-C-SC26]|uniref:sensor histidine kinase n=1 Tax=Nocardioides sp. R-C-SC26 TaxID=2870414 RepID=UPI001E28877A|nr:sensor histidine kinase [Nocardioides sp. R-C-SC26]